MLDPSYGRLIPCLQVPPAGLERDLHDVWGSSDEDVYAVGADRLTFILRVVSDLRGRATILPQERRAL